jgi:GNAT superfamily N-acetyltransferase
MVDTRNEAKMLWRRAGEDAALLLRAASGYEAMLTPYASLTLSGEPIADLNYAIIDDGPQVEEKLRQFGEVLQARDLPVVAVFTRAVADRLAPTARELGLQHAGSIPFMVYRTQKGASVFAQDTYQIDLVDNEQSLEESGDLAARAFDLPLESLRKTFGPLTLDTPEVSIFIARKDGMPVSSVMTTGMGPTIGIWTMATPPEHQRKGAGRAVLEYAIDYHRKRGAGLFYLLATEAGKPLYEKVGFQTLEEGAVWVAGHSTQVSGAS